MSDFQRACMLTELREDQGHPARIDGKLIALFRRGDFVYAIDDVCPHMGGSLSEGDVTEGIVTCPWHAWKFRFTDGTWADNPRIRIGSYPVRIIDGEVYVQVKSGLKGPEQANVEGS
jgi:nitrite reductase (NADH) small subunit/3-phenylpropionate/trans-cinnamate dioxygenase ferredoxin subunit